MRIVSWNIRAGGGKRRDGILAQLLAWQPDVIALSEFRGTPASQELAAKLAEAGWPHQLQTIDRRKPATNSLLTAAKYPLKLLKTRHAPKQPRRWLLTRVQCPTPFVLANMHIPNFNTGFKYPYHTAVLKVMKGWRLGPAIFAGDTNSGKSYIDDATGVFWRREHEWMEAIETLGWVDAFRHLHGEERVYSWYSHRDNGFRLDQAFLNPKMMPALQGMRYEWGVSPTEPERRDGLSDHAAMILDLSL
ncbi:MAG: endonuclease/exonuclease/phosphatase family protein [Chloroflexota bacterium]